MRHSNFFRTVKHSFVIIYKSNVHGKLSLKSIPCKDRQTVHINLKRNRGTLFEKIYSNRNDFIKYVEVYIKLYIYSHTELSPFFEVWLIINVFNAFYV